MIDQTVSDHSAKAKDQLNLASAAARESLSTDPAILRNIVREEIRNALGTARYALMAESVV